MRASLFVLALLAIATPATPFLAQQRESRVDRFMRNCENEWNDRERERFCEVRDVQLKVGARLYVDGRDNGGVSFYGWDKNEILVRALVQANADSKAEAQALAKDVKILTEGDRVRADGPSNRRYANWSVSYEVWVPRKMDLDAETLDLETTNGGVTLDLPRNYNAELETGTVNGGLNIDFPITVSGYVSRRIRTKLGTGGPRIRALTTNGGVRIRANSSQD